MTTGVGTTLTMGYDGLRRLTSVTGGPVSRQYTYRDIDSTKTTMQVASVTSGGQRYGYTYDSMGNIATFSAPGKGTVTYTYDNQGQLLKAAGDTTYTYTYDGAGNILTASDGTTTHSYTYGDTDWKDLLTAFNGQTITNDAIGNPTSYYNGTRWNFTWVNGRTLATASDGTNSLSFAYDASGLRTSKTVNGMYELVLKGFTKAAGMQRILEHLGVAPQDTCAIGDSTNDIPMFRFAAHSACLGGGSEPAKQAAEFVTAPVLEDGIEKALVHFGLI